jgi:glycerol-3-phosphate dehydrogenase
LPLPGIDRGAELAAMAAAEPSLAAPLDATEEAVKAEARFAASDELALHVEDVLRRRTSVALKSPDLGASAACATAELMAQPLGWTPATAGARASEYVESVRSPETSRRRA